ncbi:DUF1772 domain-containing protein [Nocardioides dongkuii]|uniref:anthrone oxygenase family protein n=1 Tax=Nocardioides dongkuii TaxID=2760089 RepID=UPI001C708B01|nr:anthrone oxygenase family protein [Nocardioides dongkuii]
MTDTLEPLRDLLLTAAVVLGALQAGTYYTWASGVMPGLARVDDRTFVHAMQQVNVAIVNPVFLASFVGAPVVAALAVPATTGTARAWVAAGAALAAATVVVTGARNIPLNNALDAAGPVHEAADLADVRRGFEAPWRRWNVVRALTSTASVGCLAWAATLV